MTAERDHSAIAGRPRSGAWFAAEGRAGMIYRSWLRAEGITPEVFDGRPVIGIANSWSELTPCNAHLRTVADAVKRGVWQAGGFPLEFPTMSLGETPDAAHRHAVPQSHGHGGRGTAAGQPA